MFARKIHFHKCRAFYSPGMLPAYQTEEAQTRAKESLRAKAASTAKNRGRIDVVADVLNACSRPASKNIVLIKANVNSVTATYMLGKLMDTRLIDTVVDEDRKVAYIATKQGISFLNAYRNLMEMLSAALVPDTKASRPDFGLFS